MKRRIALALLVCLAMACSKPEGGSRDVHFPAIPLGIPTPTFPDNNGFSDVRLAYGRALFFDKRLSIASDVSCATCHKPELAFADDLATSPGTLGRAGKRNVPTLLNVAYHPYFTREGAVSTLEQQILVPIQEHNEFGHNIVAIAEELAQDPTLRSMSMAAYGEPPSAFTITRAIAVFERTLLTGNSPYDRYQNGDPTALNASERAGMALFFSEEVGCSGCHGGFNFSEYEIVNNGLYSSYMDPGLANLTVEGTDIGKFKVPSLRNAALTPPYMHDGSLQDLDAVLEHYRSGGSGHPNQDPRVHALDLTDNELHHLKSFIHALSED